MITIALNVSLNSHEIAYEQVYGYLLKKKIINSTTTSVRGLNAERNFVTR